MTGYRSKFFRHSCEQRGCYVQQLPSWDDLIESFPRKIRPTDIDGMVEINGHVLVLEEKCPGKGPDQGQLRALKVLSDFPGVTVVFFRPAALDDQENLQVLIYPNPNGWQTVTRAWFRAYLWGWATNADQSPRPQLVRSAA